MMGWKAFRKSCYKLSDVSRPWPTAKRDCGDLGGHLLKIDDKAEQDYFYKEVWKLWHSVAIIDFFNYSSMTLDLHHHVHLC
jgi:hypothetical protein